MDTNVLLRLVVDSSDISETFKEEVDSGLAGGGIAVSTLTFVETTRLHHHGRIDLGCDPAVWRRERLRSGLREIPVIRRCRRRGGVAQEHRLPSRPCRPADRRHGHDGRDASCHNGRKDHRPECFDGRVYRVIADAPMGPGTGGQVGPSTPSCLADRPLDD